MNCKIGNLYDIPIKTNKQATRTGSLAEHWSKKTMESNVCELVLFVPISRNHMGSEFHQNIILKNNHR